MNVPGHSANMWLPYTHDRSPWAMFAGAAYGSSFFVVADECCNGKNCSCDWRRFWRLLSVCGRRGTIVGWRRFCGSDYCQVKWQHWWRWGNFFRRSRSLKEQLTHLIPSSLGHSQTVFSLYALISLNYMYKNALISIIRGSVFFFFAQLSCKECF